MLCSREFVIFMSCGILYVTLVSLLDVADWSNLQISLSVFLLLLFYLSGHCCWVHAACVRFSIPLCMFIYTCIIACIYTYMLCFSISLFRAVFARPCVVILLIFVDGNEWKRDMNGHAVWYPPRRIMHIYIYIESCCVWRNGSCLYRHAHSRSTPHPPSNESDLITIMIHFGPCSIWVVGQLFLIFLLLQAAKRRRFFFKGAVYEYDAENVWVLTWRLHRWCCACVFYPGGVGIVWCPLPGW